MINNDNGAINNYGQYWLLLYANECYSLQEKKIPTHKCQYSGVSVRFFFIIWKIFQDVKEDYFWLVGGAAFQYHWNIMEFKGNIFNAFSASIQKTPQISFSTLYSVYDILFEFFTEGRILAWSLKSLINEMIKFAQIKLKHWTIRDWKY